MAQEFQAAPGAGGAPRAPSAQRFDLARKPTREITISSHFTDRALGLAVRIDQIMNGVDQNLSRRSMDFKQSMDIQQQLDSLLNGVDESLKGLMTTVRRHSTRAGMRSRPGKPAGKGGNGATKPSPAKGGNGATKPAGGGVSASAAPAGKGGKKASAPKKDAKEGAPAPADTLEAAELDALTGSDVVTEA
jgi:hypothetical protein